MDDKEKIRSGAIDQTSYELNSDVYGPMVEELNQLIEYLRSRYSVRLYYDYFIRVSDYPGSLLYKVNNGRTDVMWVFYRNHKNTNYISVEVEPNYLDRTDYSYDGFYKVILRKKFPGAKLFCDRFDAIQNSIVEICDSIDRHTGVKRTTNISSGVIDGKWLVPCSLENNDIESDFLEGRESYWRQKESFQTGDEIYIYFNANENEIRYKARVEETGIIPNDELETNSIEQEIGKESPVCSRIRLLKVFPVGAITYNKLNDLGLRETMQEPIRLRDEWGEAIVRTDDYYRVVSFPCGSSIQFINETNVHAHPVKKGFPSNTTKWLMARANGGISECIYKVIDTHEFNPDVIPATCDENIRKYIDLRNRNMGFSHAEEGINYRFYNLMPIYTFPKPFIMSPNLQSYKYYDLSELVPYEDELSIINSKQITKDINYPIEPKRIRLDSDVVKVMCANCDYEFIKSPRCPECGQLQKYED